MSNIPPMNPATPPGVPAPFPYLVMSSTAKSTSGKLVIGGGKTLVDRSVMTIEMPGNQPSQPAPIHDIVTQMVNKKSAVD